jgi:hypothetical protein
MLDDRFWQKVSPEPNSGCWLWTGADNGEGYGTISVPGKRGHKAHRFAYELFVGPIPDGLQIDHLCRVRCCVNPAHLEAVTQKVNVQRGIAVAKTKEYFAAITHCPHGHKYSGDNLRKSKQGHRLCRTCHRDRERARYHAKKRSA